MKMEIVQPDLPLPADAEAHASGLEVTLRVLSDDAAAEPVRQVDLAFEVASSGEGKSLGGRCQPPSGRTDDDGRVKVTWFPPELAYQPGGRYFEDLEVFLPASRPGQERVKVVGLLFEPVEVTVSAREKAHAVEGTARLKVSDPSGYSQVTEFLVQDAEISIEFWNGKDYAPSTAPLRTDAKGKYRLDLPELKTPGGTVYTLDEDTEEMTVELGTDAASLIDVYEDKLQDYCPLPLLSDDLAVRLRGYRLVFAEQLAARQRDDYPLIVSALLSLQCGATHARTYHDLYCNALRIAVEEGSGALHALVMLVVSATRLAERMVGWVGTKLPASGQWTYWMQTRAGKKLFDWLSSGLKWIQGRVEQLSRALPGRPLTEWDRYMQRLIQEGQRLAGAPDSVETMAGMISLLFRYLFASGFNAIRVGLYKGVKRFVARCSSLVYTNLDHENRENLLGKRLEDAVERKSEKLFEYLSSCPLDIKNAPRFLFTDLMKFTKLPSSVWYQPLLSHAMLRQATGPL